MEVIPVVNCHTGDEECVLGRLRTAEAFAQWVHLDIADGVFTFHKTWNDPAAWKKFKAKLALEVHLMVEKPEEEVKEWLAAGAKRIIFHWESVRDDRSHVVHRPTEKLLHEILAICKKKGASAMLAVNPEMPIEEIKPHLDTFSEYQILAVNPGFAGQKFLPTVLPKVKFLRRELPNARIEVDGGITPETARLAKEAGTDVVTSSSYIFDSADPKEAYEELAKI